MAAYALVELEISDMEGMAPYMDKVSSTVEAFGGKYLVRAGETTVKEGTIGQYPLKVILEFPSMAQLNGWYDSAEYQEIIGYRLSNSECNFLFIEGV